MPKPYKTVLITDLDDTLWDWVNIWYSSFYPMFEEIAVILDLSDQELIDIIKPIHERRGTSEYTFLLQDIEAHFGRPTDFYYIKNKYDTALYKFRSGRKSSLELFAGVYDTLQNIKKSGSKIIAYTESLAFATTQRIKSTNLDGVIDILYSPRDHDFPKYLNLEEVRSLGDDTYKLNLTEHHHTPENELKPNPQLLQDIVRSSEANLADCVYVGDKIPKDIKMAKDAGVLDVFAEYGNVIHSQEYDFLRKVTHWNNVEVAEEKALTAKELPPSITLHNGFHEILDHIEFGEFAN